jgi:plastocyanin
MENQEPPINPSPIVKKSYWVQVVVLIVLVLVVVGVTALVVHHKSNNNTNSANVSAAIAPAKVSINKTGFLPQAIVVRVDQAIIWTNDDNSSHQVSSDPYPKDNTLPGLNSKTAILPGHTYSYVFKTAGTYTYHDNLNPYTFKGTIIVK